MKDENCRVAGNALLALDLLHEPETGKLTEQMLGDARPEFRRTAAWLMGRLAKPEFAECLKQAAGDEDPRVREAVARALEVFRKPEVPAGAS